MLKLAVWNIKAKLYHSFRQRFPFRFFLDQEQKSLIFLINKISIPVKVVVDLGTGEGEALKVLPESSIHKCGIDICFPMLINASKQVDGDFLNSNVTSLALKSGVADLVMAIGLLEYFTDFNLIFSEISRILKPSAYAIISYTPKNFFSFLRMFLGLKIHTSNINVIKKLTLKNNLSCIEHCRSMMQYQVLIRKE